MNVNGTLKAKVKTVIRIQPTAPLIYSQSVAHLWICSILRPDFHAGMSRETERGDTWLFVFAFAGQAATCSPPEVESVAFNVKKADPLSRLYSYTHQILWCVFGFGLIAFIIFCQWEDFALRSRLFCSVYPYKQQRRAY